MMSSAPSNAIGNGTFNGTTAERSRRPDEDGGIGGIGGGGITMTTSSAGGADDSFQLGEFLLLFIHLRKPCIMMMRETCNCEI